MFTQPTVSDFQNHFYRDFPYGNTLEQVQARDITKALGEASINFNAALWATQATYSLAFLYLAAHYLVMDLRASSQGIAGQFSWLQTNKAVGNVSEGFAVPQKILDNPILAIYAKTNYGAKYLSLVLPQLIGNVGTVCGTTQP